MVELAREYLPHSLESDARALWASRRFPAADGTVGPAAGPIVRQLLGSFFPGDRDEVTAIRSVAADADARFLGLAGRGARGTLRAEAWRGFTLVDQTGPILASLGVWTGGPGGRPWEMGDRHERVQQVLDRLARIGIVVTHDAPLRLCPICAAPRSPDQIIYQSEEGPTYLIRFPLRVRDRDVYALVWLDAPWRLLGTSALLVHPDLPYAIARYRRRGAEELVLASRSAIGRIHGWIAGSEVEIVDELPGRELTGLPYDYPLRHEFPMGGNLTPPAGTVQAVREVGDSGTGIVPLVPAHGGTDAQIAERVNIPGWPLVTPRAQFDLTLLHKYSGLDLRSGNDFVVRDLRESGAVFAELKVRRGVPHCSVCGTPLLWAPGRAWRLELNALPLAQRETFARLLPQEGLLSPGEVATWPVSDATTSDDPTAPVLTECTRCERLAPSTATGPCTCGGRRRTVRRALLPSLGGAIAAWTREDPLPSGAPFRLYLARRRAAPNLVHHLVAIAGLEGRLGELDLTLLPTIVAEDLPKLIELFGADAVRAALLTLEASTGATGNFPGRCVQEHARLSRLWAAAREVLSPCDAAMISTFARPIATALEELEPEDLAILARFERVRVQALADFDHWNAAGALRRIFRFLESDFLQYRQLTAPRLELAGMPALKRAALRTMVHVVRGTAVLLGPIAPHTAEGIHRAIAPERPSIFDEPPLEVDRALLDDGRAQAWDRWKSVLGALDAVRRDQGLAPATPLPHVALVLENDAEADRYRAERPALERLARVARLEVGSPREPWNGRQRQMRPVESEIQRVYPREASQIVHVLRRMPARSGSESASRTEMSVIIAGTPRQILPSMVEYVDVLPERVVPVTWPPGEMYVELPSSVPPARSPLPPLSADAQWVVERLHRRLDAAGEASDVRATRVALIFATEPLAGDLTFAHEAIARTLSIGEVRVTSEIATPAPVGRIQGRTRTGSRWWAYLPGLAPRPRASKPPRARRRAPRAPTEIPPHLAAPPEVDYSDEAIAAQGQRVRELGEELDSLLGAPLVGPAKVSRAWDAGFHSMDDFRGASYDALVALPGFGRPLASALLQKLGSPVPPPPPRTRWHPPRASPSRSTPPPLPPPAPRSAGVDAATSPPFGPPATALVPSTPQESVEEAPASMPAAPEPPPVPEPETGPSDQVEESPVSGRPEPSPEAEPPSAPPAWNLPPDEPQLSEEEGEAEGQIPTESRAELGTASLPPLATPAEIPAPEAGPIPPEPVVPTESAAEEAPLGEEHPEIDEPESLETEGPEPPSEPPASEPTPAQAEPETAQGPATAEPVGPAPESSPAEEGSIELPQEGSPKDRSGDANPATEMPAETVPEAIPTVPDLEAPGPLPPLEAEPGASPEPAPSPDVSAVPPSEVPRPPVPPESVEGPPAPELTLGPPPASPVIPEPIAEAPAPPPPPPPPSGGIEIEVGTSFLPSLQTFLDASAAGHQGVCVVRESPERVRAYLGGRPVEIHWLTNFGHGATLKPGDLPGLEAFFEKSLMERRVSVFFLEGIEYLVRIHGLERVLNQLVAFDAVLKAHDARAWIYVNPKLLGESELRALTAKFASTGAPVPGDA